MPFECETEYAKNSKETEKSFFIYRITQNKDKPNIYIFDCALDIHKYLQKGTTDIKLFIIFSSYLPYLFTNIQFKVLFSIYDEWWWKQ